MFDYFYEQAVGRGFKLFANPALHGGGRRIANGVLFCDSLGGTVLDYPLKTQNLIDRVTEFANAYPCEWINPFNEDGRPGNQWTTEQFNTIYASLSSQLNGAELVGACQRGIQAGILTFEQTHVDQYITIATTHNLGFQHELWPDYIALATEKGFLVKAC